MMTQDILFTQEGHIGIITLHRTKALNALTFDMLVALQQQLLLWEEDASIHAMVIQAAEGRAFCAGGDVRCIYQYGLGDNPKKMEFFAHEYRLDLFIANLKKPYIALMDGITMGGGVGISLHGSHPVATERFRFAMPETGIGLYPDIGASHLLTRCPGAWGVYLGLTGSQLGAADAYALGLVKHVLASEQLPVMLERLHAVDLSTHAHERVSEILQSFEQITQPELVNEITSNVNACFQHREMETIMASLLTNTSEWHRQTSQLLMKKSPLSLKVTLEQLQRAKSLTLAECLQMDYGLTQHFMQDSDFFEGVRALLVDKDNAPNWQPSSLSQVTVERVLDYFYPIYLDFSHYCEVV